MRYPRTMAAPPAILDQFGRPFSKKPAKALAEQVRLRRTPPLSAQTTMSVQTLAATMRAADDGDFEAFIELATEMEERDQHYYGQLSTRRLALVGCPVVAVPASDDPKAKEVSDAYQATVLEDDTFPGLVNDLEDALGKGISIVQAIWDTTRTPWGFECFEHVPAESLTYFPATSENPQRPLEDTDLHLILQDGKYARLADLPGLYLLHKPRLRTGPTMRGGFARLAARNFLLKNFTVKEWLAFAEVYGMPLRYATYDPDTITPEEMNTIAIALANLGHDASAMIPRSVELQILGEAARTGNGGSFDLLCRYLDEQLSKGILGQTMTADNGSSQSQATVHNDVRIDYKRFDALVLQGHALRSLARAWTVINYGDAALTPRTRFAVDPPEDLDSWTKAVLPWVTAGLKVSVSQVRDKLDLQEPENAEDELEIIVPLAPAPGEGDGPPAAGKKPAPKKDKATQSTTDAITGYDRLIAPHVAELEAIAAAAGDYDTFLENLALKPSNTLITRLVLEALAARQAAEDE